MHAVIFERNKLVGRKIARLFMASGATASCVDDPAQVAAALDGSGSGSGGGGGEGGEPPADLIGGDAFDGDLICEQLRARPRLRGVLWTAEPLKRCMKFLFDGRIDHVLGRRDFESAPRAWETLLVARRSVVGCAAVPFTAFLDWGFTGFELVLASSDERPAAIERVVGFVNALGIPRRVGEMFGELADELMMNAIFDAPVDEHGQPKYAFDRRATVNLLEAERPTLRCGTDGTKVVLQIRDPFGRLQRKHVFEGLARGLEGEMDSSHGGAGLGMAVMHNASSAMFFDVVRERSTEATGIFELDQNLREFRTQPRSLHFWSR